MKISEKMRRRIFTDEHKARLSENKKKFWQQLNSEDRAERIRNSFGKSITRPNKSELILAEFLKPFGFKYNTCKLFISGEHRSYIPDFVHGEFHLLIEFDGRGGHDPALHRIPPNKPELDDQRDRDYEKAGYDILRIKPKYLKKGENFIRKMVNEKWGAFLDGSSVLSFGETITPSTQITFSKLD